ncbi:hypothetical protein [Bradyrhizobium ganzhouense]|uniref:hypothetical protein n=1 Tax=Bradyrhizobium ganzhouense TaxID=1179767 RepID=UPI003CE6914A
MHVCYRVLIGYFAGVLVSLSAANAATITDNFVFSDQSGVVATGSFSYDSSKSGLLSYSDLTAFSIDAFIVGQPIQSYDLAFVQQGLSYSYFGYDTTVGGFVPGTTNGVAVIFAATDTFFGFLFDPLTSQGGDGLYAFYNPSNVAGDGSSPSDYPSFTSFSVSAVPELPSWIMAILGFAAIALITYRRRDKEAAAFPTPIDSCTRIA